MIQKIQILRTYTGNKLSSLYQIIREEVEDIGLISVPNVVERFCASVGAHLVNQVNLQERKWYSAGALENFRIHIVFMAPSGFSKTTFMSLFLSPTYGFFSRAQDILKTTVSTSFTGESWVGAVERDQKTGDYTATDGLLVRYRTGMVAADEFARLKDMIESRGEERDVSYLLSALGGDCVEKQHSGKPITIRDIGTTFWCGLRPTRVYIGDSGLARRFSFQTYYPTLKEAGQFKEASRRANAPISNNCKIDVANKIEELKRGLKEVNKFDLTDVYRFIDADSTIPHFEAQIYQRLALGFGVASDRFPHITMFKEMGDLINDEKENRRQIRANPKIEMVFHIIRENGGRINSETLKGFLHHSYHMGMSEVNNLLHSLKYASRIVDVNGYIETTEHFESTNMVDLVRFEE